MYYSSPFDSDGMPSLRELFRYLCHDCVMHRIGHGPSSSHTMGPSNAAKMFKSLYDAEADNYTVILYGSLAATGKGHMTDVAIENELKPKKVTFIWRPNETLTFHVNGMTIKAMKGEKEIGQETYYSVGGGAIVIDSELEKISCTRARVTPSAIISSRCGTPCPSAWSRACRAAACCRAV